MTTTITYDHVVAFLALVIGVGYGWLIVDLFLTRRKR